MIKKIIIICCIGIVVGISAHSWYYIKIKKNDLQTIKNIQKAKEIYDALPIWHKKINTEQDVKIGLISDTHVRPTRVNRNDKRDNAPRALKDIDLIPMQKFVAQMKKFHPEFIVHTGDVIEGTNDTYNIGMQGVQQVKDVLKELHVPIYWAIGNHDIRALTKEEFQKILGIDYSDTVFDVGDYRFIILDANCTRLGESRTPQSKRFIRGKLSKNTMTWLEDQLKTDKNVYIFMHHGTFLDDSMGDPKKVKTDGKKEYKMKQSISNAKELNALLKKYRVTAIFNGHMEARRYRTIDRTQHYSLTGTKKSKAYPQSYYELNVVDNVPHVKMFYVNTENKKMMEVDFESCANIVECQKNEQNL